MKAKNFKMDAQEYSHLGVVELSKLEKQSCDGGGLPLVPILIVAGAVVVLGGAAIKGYYDGRRNENARCRTK